jgi:hypothetical protein
MSRNDRDAILDEVLLVRLHLDEGNKQVLEILSVQELETTYEAVDPSGKTLMLLVDRGVAAGGTRRQQELKKVKTEPEPSVYGMNRLTLVSRARILVAHAPVAGAPASLSRGS